MRETAGSAAAPIASRRNRRRRAFITSLLKSGASRTRGLMMKSQLRDSGKTLLLGEIGNLYATAAKTAQPVAGPSLPAARLWCGGFRVSPDGQRNGSD